MMITDTPEDNEFDIKKLLEMGGRIAEALSGLGLADAGLIFDITYSVCEVTEAEETSEFCEEIEAAAGEKREWARIDALLRAIDTIPNREDYGSGGNPGGMRDYIKGNITEALWKGRPGGDRPAKPGGEGR